MCEVELRCWVRKLWKGLRSNMVRDLHDPSAATWRLDTQSSRSSASIDSMNLTEVLGSSRIFTTMSIDRPGRAGAYGRY